MKSFFYLFLVLILSSCVSDSKKPKGYAGTEADDLALKMFEVLDKASYDEINFLQWSFTRGSVNYRWDKKNNVVETLWKDFKTVVNLDTKEGLAYEKNAPIVEEVQKHAVINEGLRHWNTESFWLIGPFLAFEEYTERKIANIGGKDFLCITYSGGPKVGHESCWLLNDSGLPISVIIDSPTIPTSNFDMSWERYVAIDGGAKFATLHTNALVVLEIKNIVGAKTLSELGWKEDTFRYN